MCTRQYENSKKGKTAESRKTSSLHFTHLAGRAVVLRRPLGRLGEGGHVAQDGAAEQALERLGLRVVRLATVGEGGGAVQGFEGRVGTKGDLGDCHDVL